MAALRVGSGMARHPKPRGWASAPFPKGDGTVQIAEPVHPSGQGVAFGGALKPGDLVSGRKAFRDPVRETGDHAIVAFHKDIGMEKAGGLGRVQKCVFGTFDIADYEGFLILAYVEIGVVQDRKSTRL